MSESGMEQIVTSKIYNEKCKMAQKEKEAEGRRDRLSLHLSISPSLRLSFSISTILFQICLEIGVHLSCYLVQ